MKKRKIKIRDSVRNVCNCPEPEPSGKICKKCGGLLEVKKEK